MTIKKNYSQLPAETLLWGQQFTLSDAKLPVLNLEDRVRTIEKRLLIIAPPDNTLSKYPSLKEAYEHYKVIEKLVLQEDENETD